MPVILASSLGDPVNATCSPSGGSKGRVGRGHPELERPDATAVDVGEEIVDWVSKPDTKMT